MMRNDPGAFGSLVHETLAAWRFPNDRSATAERHSFERWAQARARGYGIADFQQLADAVRRSRQLLLRFRDHPLHQEMGGADQRLHEVPYSLPVHGHVETGIIDALYEQAGVWTIVEIKTDQVRNQAAMVELLAEQEYLSQARRYITAAENLLGLDPRLVFCMLNCADSVHLYQVSQV